MAAVTEFVGGILLILGFFHRIAALLLTFTMATAVMFHISAGDPFMAAGQPNVAYALEMGIIFLGMFFIGARKWSVDSYFKKKRRSEA